MNLSQLVIYKFSPSTRWQYNKTIVFEMPSFQRE